MNSLTRLKSIAIQMETRITKNTCSSFFNELSKLIQHYQNDASLTALFNMMHSLGKYLSTRKNSAHKESVPVLQSIADIADIIIQQPDLKTQNKKQMVARQIEIYKLFQNKLSSTPIVNPADIQNLKAVILSIDWEISDETLGNFEAEINRQLIIFNAYGIHHTFLKIIHSTGRYVAAHKAKAHANSIFFLRSIFKNFEHLIESPDMLFKDKKKLLEDDIKRFNEFKLKISKPIYRQTQPRDVPEQTIAPALSHIKSPSNMSAGQDADASITALEIDDLPKNIDSQNITPALSGKRKPENESTDVMGDLFSIKESPADELLDAIHLLDVHGSNPDQAMTMMDSSSNFDADGTKNYTPKRINTDPIPEIGDRLDEFFNLDTSAPEPEPQLDELTQPSSQTQAFESEPMTDADTTDGIIPFDDEDEATENVEDDATEQMLGETVKRLKSYFKSFDSVVDESWYSLVQEDISFLKEHWQTSFDKLALLDLLDSVLLLLDNQIKKTLADASQTQKDIPKGFWQKIKNIFSS
ncbi:MAG: hypothetical protein L3J69_03235 [Desulfobacula sp.]|nr:hypothetical protein [Desulfobacula sp.]